MPNLTWISIAGTPLAQPAHPPSALQLSSYDLPADRVRLGAGASGEVYAINFSSARGRYPHGQHPPSLSLSHPRRHGHNQAGPSDYQDFTPNGTIRAAVKIFHAVTSDGRPEDEVGITAMAAGVPGCLRVFAFFSSPRWGMVMELLSGFVPLGLPPSALSITRDTYAPHVHLSVRGLLAVAVVVARACRDLHDKMGIAHGDLYAHNIMVRAHVVTGAGAGARLRAAGGGPGIGVKVKEEKNRDEPPVQLADVRLTDFGAAFRYHPQVLGAQALEVRAFGILLAELRSLVVEEAGEANVDVLGTVTEMSEQCVRHRPADRPRFAAVARVLDGLWEKAEWG